MISKTKIGVFLMTAGWFREIGLQNTASNLTEEIDNLADSIIKNISKFANPIYGGIVFSEDSARNAALSAKKEGIDLILISPLMWSEDIILKTILKEFPNTPIIFCTFIPYKNFKKFMDFSEMLKGSGTVGSFQMSGFLKRGGFDYESVFGYYLDDSIFDEIRKHSMAITIKQSLKNLCGGILPFRCDQMTVTYVDEFEIHKLYGIEMKYIELQRIKNIAQNCKKSEIDDFKKLLKELNFIIEVDETNFNEGIKYSIALEKVVREEKIKFLAMNDVIKEMHDCFGLRPCVVNPRLTDSEIYISMEADAAAAIAMYIIGEYKKCSPFYTEIFCADLSDNTVLMGHSGYHDYINHDPMYPLKIVPDPEYINSKPYSGACIYYKYKPGPITLVNSIYDGHSLKWTVIEGESLQGPPKLEGNPHVHCKIDMPLKNFFQENIRNGVSQHWLVIDGHIAEDLKVLCRWINIKYIDSSKRGS